MSDPRNPNINSRNTPQWGLYQRELFWKENTGELPPFSTHPEDLEDLAKRALTSGGCYGSSAPYSTYLNTPQVLCIFKCGPLLHPSCEPTSLLPTPYYPPHAC